MLCDFDNMDYFTMEQKIREVKELLGYLNDTLDGFPYDSYYVGSTALNQAANYIDECIIHNETSDG